MHDHQKEKADRIRFFSMLRLHDTRQIFDKLKKLIGHVRTELFNVFVVPTWNLLSG